MILACKLIEAAPRQINVHTALHLSDESDLAIFITLSTASKAVHYILSLSVCNAACTEHAKHMRTHTFSNEQAVSRQELWPHWYMVNRANVDMRDREIAIGVSLWPLKYTHTPSPSLSLCPLLAN